MKKNTKQITFIDLFAGLGGTRIGFEQACISKNIKSKCVFTSEIKEHAIQVYKNNFDCDEIHGDITKISPQEIPAFDFLLAGFPCQPFSSAGKRHGFLDERGGLFFTIVNILKAKKPLGFLLENVDGLVNHNNGKTLEKIISELKMLNYAVNWKVLDSSDFGVPQKRKRIYIVGHKNYLPDLDKFEIEKQKAGLYINENIKTEDTEFTKLLSKQFKPHELYGKSIKDKRGGANNIHSWDIGLKGNVTKQQSYLLCEILKKRRYKKWAEKKGIDWMDGMPLTISEIKTFLDYPELVKDLQYLTKIGYLKFEHPKKKIMLDGVYKRVPKTDSPKGYNIVSGKLSFPIAYIIDPNDVAPTIVATEAGKIAVATEKGIRKITIAEGLSFSGFPKDYSLDIEYNKAFDLIGNTVMPPVIKAVSLRILGR
jgi:DNA (cytosine-5)-methyltransferase 1